MFSKGMQLWFYGSRKAMMQKLSLILCFFKKTLAI